MGQQRMSKTDRIRAIRTDTAFLDETFRRGRSVCRRCRIGRKRKLVMKGDAGD